MPLGTQPTRAILIKGGAMAVKHIRRPVKRLEGGNSPPAVTGYPAARPVERPTSAPRARTSLPISRTVTSRPSDSAAAPLTPGTLAMCGPGVSTTTSRLPSSAS